jgi:SM-20-related protein
MDVLRPPLSDAEIISLGEGAAVVRDDALPEPLLLAARRMLERAEQEARITPALLGQSRQHQPDLRGDWTCWLEDLPDQPDVAALWLWLDMLREEVRQTARLPLRRFSVQLARYPGDGAQYVRHRDALPGDPNRRLTAVIYLNADWREPDGGMLRVWEPTGVRDIAPLAGRLVLFLSEKLHHAVLPTHAPRLAMTAWYRGAEPQPMLSDPIHTRRVLSR